MWVNDATPGPWRCSPGPAEIDSEADARLIAAAPDLFAALAEIVNGEDTVLPWGCYDRAIAALRAAGGREE
jgi:hypothetical protein